MQIDIENKNKNKKTKRFEGKYCLYEHKRIWIGIMFFLLVLLVNICFSILFFDIVLIGTWG
jgi:hypothetical protein